MKRRLSKSKFLPAKKQLLFGDEKPTEQRAEKPFIEDEDAFNMHITRLDKPLSPSNISLEQVIDYGQIPKEVIVHLLEGIIHSKISQHVLADITGTNLTVVGRAKISGTPNQLCHVIPIAFIKEMVSSALHQAGDIREVINRLTLILLPTAKSQHGFAIKSSELVLEEYSTISSKILSCANRVINVGKEEIFLASPLKQKTLFSTPRKMQKAEIEFQEYHTHFIRLALNKLAELTYDDNTAIIISELLTRYIFSLPNAGKNTVFAPEGNTARYEIRIYETPEDAREGGKDYNIITARELYTMPLESLTQRIRIVNSEGNNIKSYIKALKELREILTSLDDPCLDSKSYKPVYTNKKIKLSNYEGDISDYNNPLILNEYIQNQVAYHIAKNLYLAFDLKALENIVFVPGRHIPVYVSAEGARIVKYEFKDGKEFRQTKMDETEYSDDRFFRNLEKDIALLPQKLAELFLIGTSPFSSYHSNHPGFLDLCLSKLAILAAKDYCMDLESSNILCTQVQYAYNSMLTPYELSISQNSVITLLGEEFIDYNQFLETAYHQSKSIY